MSKHKFEQTASKQELGSNELRYLDHLFNSFWHDLLSPVLEELTGLDARLHPLRAADLLPGVVGLKDFIQVFEAGCKR